MTRQWLLVAAIVALGIIALWSPALFEKVGNAVAIPATLEHASPYVTGVAMADAALAMAASGDLRGANAVRRRLADRFPGHPALDFEPLLRLAPGLLDAGGAVPASGALPRYIRDKVAYTTAERAALRAATAPGA